MCRYADMSADSIEFYFSCMVDSATHDILVQLQGDHRLVLTYQNLVLSE